jgi:polysaccharidase protein
MGRTFYIDSNRGSDSNSGTSSSLAFQSIAKLETISLQPGDQVLLARGSVFNDQLDIKGSGTASAPIVFGSYGTGALPIISGGYRGIDARGADYVTVENIAIANTQYDGIYGSGADNWTIRNVTFRDIGLTGEHGGISWFTSKNLVIDGNTMTNVHGDGIWAKSVDGLTINGNKIYTVQGSNSDNVQMESSSNIRVTNNLFDMTGATNSVKGNLVVEKSTSTLVDGNSFLGGSFGASLTTSDIKVLNNVFEGQKGQSWSAGVLIGQVWDANNVEIGSNIFKNAPYGINLTGPSGDYDRANFTIHDNHFNTVSRIFQDSYPISGSFERNVIETASTIYAPTNLMGPWKQDSNWYASGTTFRHGSNSYSSLDAFKKATGYDMNSSSGTTPPSPTNSTSDPTPSSDPASDPTPTDSQPPYNQITGTNANNTIRGTSGTDKIDGLGGNDFLLGKGGNDILTGGSGKDTFAFDTAPNRSTNLVTITDFNPADDQVRLENAVFTKFTYTGGISSSDFQNGQPDDSNDYVWYDRSSGTLYYDSDGNGSAASTPFAVLPNKPALTYADFIVI